MFRSRIGYIFGFVYRTGFRQILDRVAYHAGFRTILNIVPKALPVALAATAGCEDKSKKDEDNLDMSNLNHDFLIRQATTVNVNAATQLLTVTTIAIKDQSEKLREALTKEIALVKGAMELGDCTPASHWDELVAVRGTLADIKNNYCLLLSHMAYVEKLATAAAEISFLSGNQVASDALCERIGHAQRAVKEQKDLNQKLQLESLEMQKQAIAASPVLQDKIENCAPGCDDQEKKN